jgi:hypothetical protein
MNYYSFRKETKEPIYFPDIETAKAVCRDLEINFFFPQSEAKAKTYFFLQDGRWEEDSFEEGIVVQYGAEPGRPVKNKYI